MTKTFVALLAGVAMTANARAITEAEINGANPLEGSSTAATVRLQVLLDRASASPTVIDGYMGSNTERAISAFKRMNGLQADGKIDKKTWSRLSADTAPAAKIYRLTEEDVNQQLVAETPESFKKMSELDCLCFHRVSEAIAEKFHMDEDLLKRLNPNADFTKAGTELLVTNADSIKDAKVARIEIDKEAQHLLGFDSADKLVFFSPAAVGSDETPSPSGTMTVTAIAPNPTYTVNAAKNLGGDSNEKFNLAAGPNGPVGSFWIDLSKPTFGIHGTPYPSKISGMESHGCVRITNWDADELGRIVEIGATVEFTN